MDMGPEIRVIQVEEATPAETEKPDWSFLRVDGSEVIKEAIPEEAARLE